MTGGASGLGAACASRLRADGVDVITFDLAATADLRVDVTDVAAVEQAVAGVGPVDILINSAGVVGPNLPLWEGSLDEWKRTFDVNVFGLVAVTRAVVPGMIKLGWGRIVNIASVAGKEGNPSLSSYSASKAAVIGLTKSLGKELVATGVIVNAVAPAIIETPFNATTAPAVLEHMTSLVPMKRLGQPAEVAALVSWLSSGEVSFSTGAVYDISGGRATY
ncbi:MAG: SDR family NAD(P)-dependent oxidoreductase [Microcella sp.]|uniref:SDR family NAD(P)-dependent oxidoreductase n=1 Tax=Microcella sp. TaxID=1913979 RepID=UPI00331461F0